MIVCWCRRINYRLFHRWCLANWSNWNTLHCEAIRWSITNLLDCLKSIKSFQACVLWMSLLVKFLFFCVIFFIFFYKKKFDFLLIDRNTFATNSSSIVGQRECWQNEYCSIVTQFKGQTRTRCFNWWCWSKTIFVCLFVWIEIQDFLNDFRFQQLQQRNEFQNWESMILVVKNRL